MANDGDDTAGYLDWGPATVKILRTMRLEAARSGHADVMPAHVLLATLDQPEVHQALRAIRQAPNVYLIRARVADSSLGPGEYEAGLPLSRLTETVLSPIREHREGEDYSLLFLLALKATLSNQACRALLEQGGADLATLESALDRIE